MVRIFLKDYNDSTQSQMLRFQNLGNLTNPINATTVSVLKFQIPSGNIPLITWTDDYYFLGIMLNSQELYSVPLNIIGHARGHDLSKNIYLVDQICEIFNAGINELYIILGNSLPTNIKPQLTYDSIKSLFILTAPLPWYDNKNPASRGIQLSFSNELFRLIQGIPTYYNGLSFGREFEYVSYLLPNYYNTVIFPNDVNTYIKSIQEYPSTANWALARTILITTSMPIQSEVNSSIGYPYTNAQILQSFDIPYTNGTFDALEIISYVTPSDPYRTCKINAVNMYQITCSIFYIDIKGINHPIFLPPNQLALLELEFL